MIEGLHQIWIHPDRGAFRAVLMLKHKEHPDSVRLRIPCLARTAGLTVDGVFWQTLRSANGPTPEAAVRALEEPQP